MRVLRSSGALQGMRGITSAQSCGHAGQVYPRDLRRAFAQRGQALVLALGLLVLGAVALRFLFESGQLTVARQRLTDTADAAALSAATWRARVLNFHAYSNRAIIANEVAIAQAVTLVAWANYFETLTRNSAAFGAYLPPVEPVLTVVAEAATLAAQVSRATAALEIPARGAPHVGYKALLQSAQEVMHLSSLGFALNMVTAEVARASHSGHFAWVLPDPQFAWSGFTARATDGADRKRVADLVRASLDPFVGGARSEDIHTPIPSLCLNLMRLRKRGITTLSEELDRWEAVDTLSFHLRRLSWFRCREREALPLGWGAAEAGQLLNTVTATTGDLSLNPMARELAGEAMFSTSGYEGIARLRELNYEALANTRFPAARLAVVARRDQAPGQSRMWALSSAEVHFRRPPGAPVRTEYASLFNPYWQARLVAPSMVERSLALTQVD
ncbi:MAG: pilus assembly protein TadG-related protein [Burkholderiales bacterium]|jgi:hypothetical protein